MHVRTVKSRRRLNKKKILGIYLIVLLILVEAGLQVTYRIQTGGWLWNYATFRVPYVQPVNDRRQYTLIPNYDEDSITISPTGFRLPLPRDNGPLIVCAGDSVPFGLSVANDQTYPTYLAQQGENVLNAGVPSYDLRQSFDRLRIDVLPRYPNTYVVTMEAANDPQLLYTFNKDWSPDSTWASVRMGVGRTPIAMLTYFNNIVTQFRGKSHFPLQEWLDNERAVLREGLTMLRAHHITVILLPINPFYYQQSNQDKNPQLPFWSLYSAYPHNYSTLHTEYNAVLREMTSEFDGVYYLDTIPLFDSLDRSKLYDDYIHYSPAGNQLIANEISKFLAGRFPVF